MIQLGIFSISLSVKDLQTSKEFYESLGFQSFMDTSAHHYLIMKQGNTLIGLFQGMFQGNVLTFNPGWDSSARNLPEFDDVRKIQAHLKNEGIELVREANNDSTGPEHIILQDPDGNTIMIDQHR